MGETELEGSIKSSGTNQTFEENISKWLLFATKRAVLGNILKRKTKITQSDLPNFTGNYFGEYTLCFLLSGKIHQQNFKKL